MNMIKKAMDNKGISGADIQKDVIVCSNISDMRDFYEVRINPNLEKYYNWSIQMLLGLNGGFESMNEEVEC